MEERTLLQLGRTRMQRRADGCRVCAQRGYDADWLGGTFSRAVFVGNGLVAILAGLAAHSLVETLSLGPVAPFDAAAAVMLVGGVLVAACWTENYGDASDKKGFAEQLQNGARAIARGARPRRCGLAACLSAPDDPAAKRA